MPDTVNHQILDQLFAARNALELIATPARPDGTFNRSREACQQLAEDALLKIDQALRQLSVAPGLQTEQALKAP